MTAPHGLSWLNAPVWLPLVHALLHTLWQGALAAGGLFVALRFVPARRAGLRYGLSLTVLALVLLLGLGSWALLDATRRSSAGTVRLESATTVAAPRLPGDAFMPRASTNPALARKQAVSESANGPDAESPGVDGVPKAWVRWVTASWLAGVGVSLLRTAKGTFGAGRLRRRCRALADPRILAMAEELRERLGLARRVRFLVSEEIGMPSVMGVFWPAVLLPGSLLTGVPAEQLRAILAHELAHVRRWDYLVNLAQMFVEAFLFFNPFVWWVSRQVRLEREACCDQLAAGECQSPARYVEALVAVIERGRPAAHPTAPTLAATGHGAHRGNTLERARRLLVPGYQPVLRLRWLSLAVVMALSGLAISGLWLGTRAMAQTITTTNPKPDPKITDDPSSGTSGPASYKVKIVTADGSPLGDNLALIHNHNQFTNSGEWMWHTVNPDGAATVAVPVKTRTEWLAASKEGYATVFAGPFTPQTMGKINGLELKLVPGHAATIETVDEAGQPIAGAVLTARYPGPPEVAFGEVKTGATGLATLEHLAQAPLNVRVHADGYQADEVKNIPLDPAKPFRWTLKKTAALHGTVTAAATGLPIAGAVVRLAHARGGYDEDHLWPGSGPVLATTDGQGTFALGSLRPDSRYWLAVDAPGYGGAYVSPVTLAQGELKVALGPEIMIHGKIVHAPPGVIHEGKLTLKVVQGFVVDSSGYGALTSSVELVPVKGEDEFTVGPLYKGYPEVYSTTPNPGGSLVSPHTYVSLSVDELPRTTYVPGDPLPTPFILDLAAKPADAAAGDVAHDDTKTAAPPAASPAATSTASSADPEAASAKEVADGILAAARAGDGKKVSALIEATFRKPRPAKFRAEDAARLLNELTSRRELPAFTTLYDQLKETNYLGQWKPTDESVAGLVKDGRRDWLEAMITRGLSLERLGEHAKIADQPTAEWITGRVAQIAKQRADIEALEKAAADGDLPAMQRLLDGGADVNGVGKDDNTPLIRAVFKNRLEAAQFLLDHGALVDKPRLPGWDFTPLCLVNSVPMAELLKKNGANVHAKLFRRDVSILTYVVDWAKADVVAWFLKQGLDARMIGDNRENLLFGLEDGATAEVLLDAGADPNQMNEFGHTPLTAAQSAEVVRALVRHGADLKPKLKDGATLLEYAVINTQRVNADPEEGAAYIEELIKQGAEFDPKGNGVRAMLAAAFHDRVGEVRAFLDHGVSPDASYKRGSDRYQSALSSAALQAPKSLKLLLERGANPNAPVPAAEMTPLESALNWGAFGNVDLLRQAGAKGLSDLAYHSAKGDLAKMNELLDAHADPDEAGASGATPLIYAVRRAQVEAARLLLDHGASVDQFDGFGVSPYLEFARLQWLIESDPGQAKSQWRLSAQEAKARLASFQQLFTQHPPNFAYRNGEGWTALHQAAWTGNSSIAGFLLQGHPPHVDPDLPDKEGRSALLLVALSPAARDTQENIITNMDTPQQKTWNQQASVADELIQSGARLDLVLPGGKTVGALALEAARDAHNAQLAGVLSAAVAVDPKMSNPKSDGPAGTPTATPMAADASPLPPASPAVGSPALPYKIAVTPEIKRAFHGGDGIEIREVTGTEPKFQVGGTYRVVGVCRQETLANATLYLGNTAERGADAIVPAAGSSLSRALPNGSSEFDFTFALLRPGILHVTIYDPNIPDKNDMAYEGIYLGDVVLRH